MPIQDEITLSIVMPCLNEAETVASCVRAAIRALEESGITGEVVVADNGSTDGSQERARAAGAVVVSVMEKGYGAALMGGISAARGRFIVMGDADDSYDFGQVPQFVAALEQGNDLVMGSRFAGGIDDGAMPFLHRWLGNPVLTGLGRLLFRAPVSDFHCGLRGFRRDAVARMGLRTTGMEFASEMVVKSALFGLKIAEIPVALHRDGRSRPPHLRTWRDGWRHLRFLLLYSPRWLFLLPGLLLVTLGAGLIVWLLPGPRMIGAVRFDVHTMLGAAAMVLVGTQAIAFGVFAKIFAVTEGLLPLDARLEKAFEYVTLEVGLALGALLGLLGCGFVGHVLRQWALRGYGDLPFEFTMRSMVPGVLLLVLAAQAVLSSFFLSILGLKRR